jgi:hypothetical protein
LDLCSLLGAPGWRDTAVLAGEKYLTNGVRAVQIAATLTLREVLSGSLLVVLSDVERSDWRIDAVLHKVRAADGAGLVIPGPTPLTRGTVMLADRLGLPVLGVADAGASLDLAISAREILAQSLNVRARLLLEANSRFAAGPAEPGHVVHVIESVLGVEAAVVDREAAHLAERFCVPLSMLSGSVSAHCTGDGFVLVTAPVAEAGHVTSLWLVARFPARLPGWLAVVTDVLALAAAYLQRWRIALRLDAERDARRQTMLLGELMQLTAPPSALLRQRLQETEWVVDGWHLGFFFSTSSDVTSKTLVREVSTTLRKRVRCASTVIEHGDGCIGWLTYAAEPTVTDIADGVSALRSCQRALRPTLDTALGVGRPRLGPMGISETLGEAIYGARLAERRAETGNFVDASKFGATDLLLAWARTETFMPVAIEFLEPLERLSEDLLRTLSVYLDAESSLTEAAGVLGVHRNTVAGRIARIQSLLGLDLTDPDVRLAIQLACRAIPQSVSRP